MYSRRNGKGELLVGELTAPELAERYGTPVYVSDADRIMERYGQIERAFSIHPTRIHYACKANTNRSILKLLAATSCRIDAVSANEVRSCLDAGFPPERIMFTGPNVPDSDIGFLVGTGVCMNFDSLSVLRRYALALSERDNALPPAMYSFRVNPEVGAGHHEHCITGARESKFGIPVERIADAYREAKKLGLTDRPLGLHAHIGSGILEPDPFLLAVDSVCAAAGRIMDAGFDLDVVDVGGGFGIPYRPEERELDIEATARLIVTRFAAHLPDTTLAIEPGRFLVADSTYVLTRVNTVKQTPVNTYVGVDAGFNTMIRTAMYGSYHQIYHASREDGPTGSYEIGGPLCESGDIFARGRELPLVREGDLLAIGDAGAYGFTMASRYNSRPLPGEVLVRGGKHGWMRLPESYEDVVSKEVCPSWL